MNIYQILATINFILLSTPKYDRNRRYQLLYELIEEINRRYHHNKPRAIDRLIRHYEKNFLTSN